MDMGGFLDGFLVLTEEELHYKELFEKGLAPSFPAYIREKGGVVTLEAEPFLDSGLFKVVKHPCFLPRYMHDHSFIETALVLKGACIQEIGGDSFTMREGEALIISPGHFHSISVFDEASVVLDLIVPIRAMNLIAPLFSFEESDEASFLMALAGEDPCTPALYVKGTGASLPHLEKLAKGPETSAGALSALSSFFASLIGETDASILLGKEDRKARKLSLALSLIRNDPRAMTLTYLAEKTGLSPAYLSSLIHENTGMTFSELLTRRKMEVAASLLEEKDPLPLEAIADQIGYGSAQHFCRRFRAWSGMTPLSWHRAHLREGRTSP